MADEPKKTDVQEPEKEISNLKVTPEPVAPKPEAPKTPEAPVADVPKNKAEWDALRQKDPIAWGNLTQERMNQTFREKKETEERLEAERQRAKNLELELQKYKTPKEQAEVRPQYGNGVYPQTQDEWDALYYENPVFATDLRYQYNRQNETNQTQVAETRKKSLETLTTEHSDMYLPELDSDGKPKVDQNGKVVIRRDPNTGGYMLNLDSEKAKLWMEIENEDPQGWYAMRNPLPPMMAEMERRLRLKGAAQMQAQNNQQQIDQSDVAPEGVPPPRTTPLKFASEEEKAHAQYMVSKGQYASLDEAMKSREEWKEGYMEKNVVPDFTKK